ncbi:MAG TPA: CopD family protein [Chitinophagales bacterium]
MYAYIKALHIIFVVTWFSGLFYIVRLFIYNTEANEKPQLEKDILQRHFSVMIKRLWLGITFPSAVLTLILGLSVLVYGGWLESFAQQKWLHWKLLFVIGLYAYHFSLHAIYRQQMRGEFKYTSNQLRIWNEVATLFLVAIVFLVVVKDTLSLAWGLVGLALLIVVLMTAIRVYRKLREK